MGKEKQLSMFQPSMHEVSGLAPATPTPRPAARVSDPESSHEAADRMHKSGHAKADHEQILSALRRKDGQTAFEIAAMLGDGWDNVRVSRRMKELEDAGKVKRGNLRATGPWRRRMLSWWLQ